VACPPRLCDHVRAAAGRREDHVPQTRKKVRRKTSRRKAKKRVWKYRWVTVRNPSRS
jgi:hypothetical protein